MDTAKAKSEQLYVAFIDFQKAYDYVFRDGLFYKMLRSQMIGPVYRIIYSMYESVSSVVRQGLDVSSVIYQHVGLRQGCILSPCLFSLFIADFPKYLEESKCIGVQLHNEWVRILLYADDGALVAQSADDLQHMLDALHAYCAKWRLFVNTDKTKVIVFNHTSRTHVWLQNKPVFTYNGSVLEIVDEFKYLGVLFHTHIRHTAALEHRLTQSKRLVAM